MNRIVLIILFANSILSITYCQNRSDYVWVMGASPIVDLMKVGGNIIDFNNGGQIDTTFIGAALWDNNVSISDKEGNLLFYSNGCKVIDSTHQLMENGDSINYGEAWEQECSFYTGLLVTQNSIILPDPGNDLDNNHDGYYLIHNKSEIQLEPVIKSHNPELYYSYIDMNKNDGLGKVTEKDQIIFSTSSILPTYLTACKHANGTDWWIIEQEQDTNVYFKVLLTADTIMLHDSQSLGPKMGDFSGFGQAKFTPDGSKYLLYNKKDGVLVYDFDRETGELDNFRQVITQDSGRFLGLAISSNSRFAYLSATTDLYQIDLWSDDIQSSLTHIDHIDGFKDPTFASLFGQAQLAPDCKIYIVSSTTNNHLHVINKPNEEGKACDFRQHSVYLPHRNSNNSLPNFPHFRIDEEDICDSTITWIPDEYIVKAPNALSVYPNPASVSATISVFSSRYEYGKIRLFDINGAMVRSMDIDSDATLSLDVQGFTSGVYVVEYVSYLNGGRDLEKLVVF